MSNNRSMPAPPAPVEKTEIVESESEIVLPAPPTTEPKNDSVVSVKRQVSGVEVVAQGPGFYRRCRKKLGDKFMIKSMDDFGNWMKLADPSAEAARVKELAKKKAKQK